MVLTFPNANRWLQKRKTIDRIDKRKPIIGQSWELLLWSSGSLGLTLGCLLHSSGNYLTMKLHCQFAVCSSILAPEYMTARSCSQEGLRTVTQCLRWTYFRCVCVFHLNVSDNEHSNFTQICLHRCLLRLQPKVYLQASSHIFFQHTCVTTWTVHWAISTVTSECTAVLWLNASSVETDTGLQLWLTCCPHYTTGADKVYY